MTGDTSKFKVGDRVRVLRHRNSFGDDLDSEIIGNVYTIDYVMDDVGVGEAWTAWSLKDTNWWVRSGDIELANDNSLTRSITRREIVPGMYGVIRIDLGVRGQVLDLWKANPNSEELRDAARIFNEIADVLDEQSAEAQKEAA